MAPRASIPRLIVLTFFMVTWGLFPARAETPADPTAPGDGFLHFPGLPPIPIRPRDHGIESRPSDAGGAGQGPSRAREGAAPRTPPMTPVEKADAIRRALAPRPPVSVMRRRALDELYAKLAAARDTDESQGIAGVIGGIWMRSDSDTANLLMQRAVASIEAKNYPLALGLLDRLVALQPNWPEAWNKRASARFFAGDLDGSMADVGHVLKLEPRHFGALEGMATILEKTGFEKRALEVYRRALAIYPHQPAIETIVERLTLDVEGRGI